MDSQFSNEDLRKILNSPEFQKDMEEVRSLFEDPDIQKEMRGLMKASAKMSRKVYWELFKQFWSFLVVGSMFVLGTVALIVYIIIKLVG